MSNWLVMIPEHTKVEELGLNIFYPDVWNLLSVIMLCGISILFTVFWLLAVWEYVWLKDRRQNAIHTQ